MTTPSAPTTVQLLESFHGGDRSVLGEILERQRPWLWSYVRRNMGKQLRLLETSEDIVQDTLRRLIEHGPAFVPQDDGQFRRLAATIVMNRLRDRHDYVNAGRRDPAREVPIGPGEVSRIGLAADSVETPSRVAEGREDTQLLLLAIELLDPDDAHILRRHRWDGADMETIGVELGLSSNAAQKRHVRAVAKLGGLMRQLEAGDLERAELEPDPLGG